MTDPRERALLRDLNREIERAGEAQWFNVRRVHPERQIRAPLVRASETELLARAFFAQVARDPELLGRRAGILLQWAKVRNRPTISACGSSAGSGIL